jgi:hypothetical protein
LLLLPAMIYAVGAGLLGAYGGGPHLGSFFGDFFRNLASGSLRTWFIVLSPYLFVWLLRLIFRSRRLPAPQMPDDPGPDAEKSRSTPRVAAHPAATAKRREPFVGS